MLLYLLNKEQSDWAPLLLTSLRQAGDSCLDVVDALEESCERQVESASSFAVVGGGGGRQRTASECKDLPPANQSAPDGGGGKTKPKLSRRMSVPQLKPKTKPKTFSYKNRK